jgi:hypothetical protein
MGFGNFLKAVAKASTGSEYDPQKRPSSGGNLGFQEAGTSPKRDKQGRVIVTVKGGTPGAAWGVNLSKLDYQLANKLAGKVNEDEEFSKSIKVRMRPDKGSEYANSVLLETLDGAFIGWILKDASDDVVSVMAQVKKAVVSAAPELASEEFTFEMSAKIEGHWDEVGENDEELWDANIQSMLVRMKNPAELDVEAEK